MAAVDGQPTVRVRVYESDPLITFVDRAGELEDYYEIPAVLVDKYEAAERERKASVEQIEKYIRDNNIPKIDPMEEL